MVSFVKIPVSKEGRSLVEWLDESIRELEKQSRDTAHSVALSGWPRDYYLCIEQALRTLKQVREAV